MHYVNHRSHQMQKTQDWHNVPRHAFCGTCTRNQKYCIDLSLRRRTRTQCVTCRSQGMKKHKFGVTCPGALFVGSALDPPKYEK
jgi:hypothetical protein